MISGTRAAMLGTTPLYHFQNLVPQNYVIFYLQDTTVTWDVSSGDGGAVLYLGGTDRQLLRLYSGFYMVNTMATNVAHMMHQGVPLCDMYCIDIYQGLLSIDNATCNNCRGSFILAPTSSNPYDFFLSSSSNGTMRFSNLTMTGNHPILERQDYVQCSVPQHFLDVWYSDRWRHFKVWPG